MYWGLSPEYGIRRTNTSPEEEAIIIMTVIMILKLIKMRIMSVIIMIIIIRMIIITIIKIILIKIMIIITTIKIVYKFNMHKLVV